MSPRKRTQNARCTPQMCCGQRMTRIRRNQILSSTEDKNGNSTGSIMKQVKGVGLLLLPTPQNIGRQCRPFGEIRPLSSLFQKGVAEWEICVLRGCKPISACIYKAFHRGCDKIMIISNNNRGQTQNIDFDLKMKGENYAITKG